MRAPGLFTLFVAAATAAAEPAPPAPGCAACEGACVDTARRGPVCLPACTHDADCSTDDGYLCDPVWHACALPNEPVIVAKSCPGPVVQDPAFAASEPWAPGGLPGGAAAAVARDRTWIAVWRELASIELATSRDGAAWSSPHPVQADDGSALGTPLVAAGAGMVYVLYGEGDDGLRVRASRDGGATFTTAGTPLAGAAGSAVVDDTGALHAVTLHGDEHGGYGSAMQTIEYTVSRDRGATFSAPLVVSGRDELLPTYFARPSLAVDARRRWLYIAYVRGGRDAVWDVVIAATRDGGKTWTRRTFGDGCALHFLPALAVDPATGTLHVAYVETAGVSGRLVHATCTPGAAKCTAWGAINTVPFAALSLGPRNPRAIALPPVLAVEAAARRLVVRWQQPVVDQDQVVPRMFQAAAKLR